MDKEERIARAKELFKSGFNCSQSVVAAFADLYGLTEEQALKVSASFGGGIGRMRETCGAACGIFLLAGLKYGSTDPKNADAKGENYRIVQELAEDFKKANGFLKCRDLLGLDKNLKESPQPAERNAAYYAKRPCVEIVASAARIWAEKHEGL
ncbi:MAG: C_GCAxxG_C_C family protein [Paludibacteraceae bacterium]|nr:C_GCAxxG_C_C family protein [Paludibacteraceae bacterium]